MRRSILAACLLFVACGRGETQQFGGLGGGGSGANGGRVCGAPRLLCGGECLDVSSDPFNCGDCATVCPVDEVCVQGACELDCPAGLIECEDRCRDPLTDRAHCGTCGRTCEAGFVCSQGNCELSCGGGLTECDGVCRDTERDEEHCGGCGIGCGPGELCRQASCRLSCPAGFAECDGACRDLQTDREHCGRCGQDCGPGEVCGNGACTVSCPGGQTECDGQCYDLNSTFEHCGRCGRECAQGGACEMGACTCPGVQGLACDGTCVDAAVDLNHCGGCGQVCPTECTDGDCLTVEALTGGVYFNTALMSDGTVRSWGRNFFGSLGNGTSALALAPVPLASTSTLGPVQAVSTGFYHACAKDQGSRLWCWGYNQFAQVAPDRMNREVPFSTQVTGVDDLQSGGYFNCFTRANGTVWCFGAANQGQLGSGSGAPSFQADPVQVTGLSNVVQLSSGFAHACAVVSDGRVFCWGSNSAGQIGDGSGTNSFVPTQVTGLPVTSPRIRVSAGFLHTCALLPDGRAACWGNGSQGTLGNGSFSSSTSPVIVSNVQDFVAIQAGPYHNCGVRRGGELRCWGSNTNGQLGNNSTSGRAEPVTVTGLPPVAAADALALGFSHTCARLTDGSVRCWGDNAFGQIGDGTASDAPTPRAVAW